MRLPFPKRFTVTPELQKKKLDAEIQSRRAKAELEEAKELAGILREIREKNHFASSFRKALEGNSGS